jgi:Ino eighty subunit 2
MRANEVDSLHDTLGGGRVLNTPRSSRRTTLAARAGPQPAQRSKYAEYGESDIGDEDEEEEDEEEEDSDDAEEEEEQEDDQPNDFDELGAEPEGDTDDEDIEMEDATPQPPPSRRTLVPRPPKITLKPPAKIDGIQHAKPKLIVTPAKVGPVPSVEDQEMEDDPDDDEVEGSSDLSDEDDEEGTNQNDEDAEGEVEEVMQEDAPGEDEELGAEEDAEEDDDEELDDSSDETPASGAATPDINRLTKRQRGRPEDQTTLLALDMAPQQRKVCRLRTAFRLDITTNWV